MQLKLIVTTFDAAKSWAFYSAIGIRWLAGEDRLSDPTELQSDPNPMGLPVLWGDFGGTELIFFSDTSPARAEFSMILQIDLEDDSTVAQVLSKLESIELFVSCPEFNREDGRVVVLDPDGRRVELCSPSPFRL